MPFIENVSYFAIERGFHYDAGPNSTLIQIVDPDMEYPEPKYDFKRIFRFKFLDIEEENHIYSISRNQASIIAKILEDALDNHSNVIVHCHAGVCRSGAVAEVGVMMGFQDTEVYRQPNILVKTMIVSAIDWRKYEPK